MDDDGNNSDSDGDISSYNSDDEAMDDDYDSDEEWAAERQRERDEALRKIERNDPSFTTLEINTEMEDNWEELGTAIGRNTHLKELILNNDNGEDILANKFRDFARGLAFNRSIQKLSIGGWDHSDYVAREEAWEHLIHFFINNEALCSLELESRWDVGNHRELVSALRRFASLKEVNLYNHYPRNYGVCVDDIIEALIGHHTGLKKLTIKGFDIGRVGCATLATSSLTELHLQPFVHINGEGAREFSNGLARNATLKVLEIFVETCITKTEWQPIITAFSTSKVESLIVTINHLTDATAISLSNALLHNITLKSLSLTGNRNGTNSGWIILATSLREIMLEKLHISDNFIDGMGITAIAESLENNSSIRELDLSYNSIGDIGVTALSTVLRHPISALEKLDVKWNSIGEMGATVIADALENNFSLRELSLSGNSIGDIGVTSISNVLRHPNSTLEKLDISVNSIGDIGINALTNSLLNNSMLNVLSIGGNPDVTPAGWANFSTVLRNPTSALEVLRVWSDSINDEVLYSFADALANNKKLKGLDPNSGVYCKVTSDGYEAMTYMLCNTSSILSTFNSNHTLQLFYHDFRSLPNDLSSLLRLNRESSVSQAARLKIIKSHFSGSEINMQPFMEMNLNVRPHAIAWMAKDIHLYELLRAMPSLLEQFEDDVIGRRKG